jgi:hypothetical protein
MSAAAGSVSLLSAVSETTEETVPAHDAGLLAMRFFWLGFFRDGKRWEDLVRRIRLQVNFGVVCEISVGVGELQDGVLLHRFSA